MTSVSGDRVSRKVQLRRRRGDSDDPDVGAQLPDMCDFACELAFSVTWPAALRHAAEIEGLQTLAPGVVEGNRAAGGLAPGGLGTPSSPARSGTMTPSSDTEALTARAVRPRRHGCCPASRGRGSPSARAWSVSGAAGCSPTASCRRSSQRTPPLPAPCSDPSSADRAEPPAAW